MKQILLGRSQSQPSKKRREAWIYIDTGSQRSLHVQNGISESKKTPCVENLLAMHLNLAIVQLFAAFIVQWSHAQQGNPESDPYVPVYAECPQNLSIRNTSDVWHKV